MFTQICVRTADRLVLQVGNSLGELDGCVVEDVTTEIASALNSALAINDGAGVTISPNHLTITQKTKPPPAPTTPTIVAKIGLGTNPPTPTIVGDDESGVITVGTGLTPTLGDILEVVFAQAKNKAPIVVVTPQSAGAAKAQMYLSAVTATGFKIAVASLLPSSVAAAPALMYVVRNGK